jgi:SecD/SecF fusion protein
MKGLIKIFLVLLVLVSLLQAFYMMPTRKVEADADAFAQQYVESHPQQDAYEARKSARANYLDSLSSEDIFSIPGIGSFSYNELKQKQLALGLDLKGGMSSVLQVDLKEMLENLSRNSRDEAFNNALAEAEAAQSGSQSDFISLFGQAYNKQPNKKKLAYIFRRDGSLEDKINTETSDGEVLRILREKADETVGLTFKMLKERINKLGVAQPNVSLDEGRDLILVEMPGIENPERAREFLTAGAALEFWDTYRSSDLNLLGLLEQADSRLKSGTDEVAQPATQMTYDTIWTQTLDSDGNLTGDSTSQVIETPVQNSSFNQGPLLSLLTLNNGQGDMVWGPVVLGFAEKNKRKAVMEMLSQPNVASLFPVDSKFMWSRKPFTDEDGETTSHYMLYLIKKQVGTEKAPLEGDAIVASDHQPDPTTGEMTVNLRMNNAGAQKWGEMTTKAANDGNREVAICIDNEVISAPRVNGPIPGGNTQITGNFTVQEAADFSSLLEIGKLPAGVKTIQESTVGPSLGKKNINSSLTALAVGFGLILLFMVFYYAGGGFISILALLLNMFFIFGALASFGTVLTLPGIAGIVLTIGMAVDANVIIFERIREELRAGKSVLASINDGFRHSYSAIIDANVTTLLVAFVLAYFGLGPIKGFAVVLIIGVLSSLFTAVLVGRMLIDWWTKGNRNLNFWTGASKNAFANLKIDWLGKRTIAWIMSGVIILAGLASMFTRGFDLGVDFKGGYSYNVEFPVGSNVTKQSLEEGLTAVFDNKKPVVKAVNTQNTFNIVTDYLVNDNSEGAADKVIAKLHEGVASVTGSNVTFDKFKLTDAEGVAHVVSSSKVGPTIADDIKTSSFYAGIFALLLIFLYIFIRFNKWQFSLGAVAALFHDTLVVLSVFSLLHGVLPFSLEIDQAFIAAILTVIGYSINDTVVLFDRIREFLGIYPKKDTDAILNMAINSTFSRTIITSITTLIMITPLFIFGGGSIKGFAFALIVGIIVGTYSSIFIATPIVKQLSTDLKPKKIESKKSFSKAAKAAK